MNDAPMSLWLFWAAAAACLAGLAFALATRRLKAEDILTRREWVAAFQLGAIILMILLIIYFQNANRYDAEGFIYGRF